MSELTCNHERRAAGLGYPRTCRECKFGPCKYGINPNPKEPSPRDKWTKELLDLVQPHLPGRVFQDLENLLGRIPN